MIQQGGLKGVEVTGTTGRYNACIIRRQIIGAAKMAHLEQDVAVLEIDLSAEERAYLEEPYRPHPVLRHE